MKGSMGVSAQCFDVFTPPPSIHRFTVILSNRKLYVVCFFFVFVFLFLRFDLVRLPFIFAYAKSDWHFQKKICQKEILLLRPHTANSAPVPLPEHMWCGVIKMLRHDYQFTKPYCFRFQFHFASWFILYTVPGFLLTSTIKTNIHCYIIWWGYYTLHTFHLIRTNTELDWVWERER